MSNFKDSPKFSTHDDYYTPKSAWEQIKPFIEKRGFKKVFEPFLLNSNEQSKKHLEELEFKVIGNKTVDFLNEDTWTEEMKNKNYDCIISNPPFQRIKSYKQRKDNLKYKCIKKLIDLDKPFIIIMNSLNIYQKWFMELVKNKDFQMVFPSEKIQFTKYEKGGINKIPTKKEYLKYLNKKIKELTEEEEEKYETLDSSCSFNCVYLTYKILDKNEWV